MGKASAGGFFFLRFALDVGEQPVSFVSRLHQHGGRASGVHLIAT